VKNYREYDTDGNPVKGKFARWFEEIYTNEISKPAFRDITRNSIDDIHNGYFSSDNKGRLKDTGDETQLDETKNPLIRSTREKVLITDEGVSGQLLSDSADNGYTGRFEIPDILSYIQSKTELTRNTIFEILKRANRLNEAFINPQLFMDNAVLKIREELHRMMIEGIKYEKFGDKVYEMTLFDDSDLEIYIDNFTHIVRDSSKTIYNNYIPLDSSVENRFAMDCESSEQVEFYFKIPYRFEINTPIGRYRPDWAVVFKGEKKIYFVAETKSAGEELRESEKLKIACGTAHFKDFDDVVYKRVSTVTDLKNL